MCIRDRNQITFYICAWVVEDSWPIDFGEDRLRERGNLPATFNVLTRVIVSMTNDNCRTFKQNQIILCIPSSVVDNSRSFDFVEDRLRERGSLPATFNVLTRGIVSMTNDNCRTFKQNQIMFCIRPWILKDSRPFDFGEDQLKERGIYPVSYTHLDVYKRQT